MLSEISLCDPRNSSPPGSSVNGENTGVGCPELNMGFLNCRQILYDLRYQGSPSQAEKQLL